MTQKRRVLIVGAGSIGERHTRCFGLTGRADISLCEVDSQKCREVAERYGLSRARTSWEDSLAEQPEVVVIATPAHLHISMAKQAVAQGSHVLIEKPLSTSLTGIEELQLLIDEKRVQVSIAYVYRCHPALISMRSAIHSGRFGRPLQVIAISGQHFPLYRPAYRETYYTRHETGGGAVQDALTHVINAAEWLVGPIDRLVADADHLALPGVDVEDTAQVLTRHGSVLGCFQLNQHQAPNEGFINVVCEKGTASFEIHTQRWRWVVEPGGAWSNEEFGPLERDSLFIAQANQFLDVVEGKAMPACALSEAAQTLRVNLAILESIRQKSWRTVS